MATWLWVPSLLTIFVTLGFKLCRSSVPLFVPDVVEVVPWSLSHQDEWWCDVEWGGGGDVPTRIGSSTKPCQLEVHLPSIDLNTLITLNHVQVANHL